MKLYERLPKGSSVKERLEAYHMPVTECGCWIWLASGTYDDYGKVWDPVKGNRLAHRASYEEFVGPIPEGLCVLHRCDTPPCINPDHLFLGTKQDNTRDMMSKGRGAYGPKDAANNSAKLTEQNVEDILIILHTTTKTHVAIGRMFGISRQAVSAISAGTSWRFIKRPGE